MKKNSYEEVLNATTKHLAKRNCTVTRLIIIPTVGLTPKFSNQDSETLKRAKVKLRQSAEQFENSPFLGHKKIISLQNYDFSEQEANIQYSK